MKNISLALDSRPLGSSIFNSLDYTGLQLYGLEHRPFGHAIDDISSAEGGCRWRVTMKDVRWNDRSPILPEHYLQGLQLFLQNSRWVKKILLRNLKSIRYSGNVIDFSFSAPFVRFKDLCQIPNWAPLREGRFSGPFQLRPDSDIWQLHSSNGSCGTVRIVHSPAENLRAFENGIIDVTADTAFPLEQMNDSVEKADTGLFAVLAYSKDFSAKRRLEVDLSSIHFDSRIEASFTSLRKDPIAGAGDESPCRIMLAFDNFYPNREICEAIADHLNQSGWIVELCEDNYYRPTVEHDVKFTIFRAVANNDLFLSASLFSLPAANGKFLDLFKKFQEIENGLAFDFHFFSEFGLAIPLFKIPSLYLSRLRQPNPLLRVFL